MRTFGCYGTIANLRLVRDRVTGESKGYCFVTYESDQAVVRAFRQAQHMRLDGAVLLVDFERERVMKGWVPRRLGGGLGGKKTSGQMRFGGAESGFKFPFIPPAGSNENYSRETATATSRSGDDGRLVRGREMERERDRGGGRDARRDRDVRC